MRASVCSLSPCGASYPRCTRADASGAGSAFRSSLPFVVSGNASSTTNALGTM